MATRAGDGGYAFLYSTRGEGFTVDMRRIAGNRANAWWFNPRDGRCYNGEENAVAEPFGVFNTDETRTFNPPGAKGKDRDWVLVLDDASENYGIPG